MRYIITLTNGEEFATYFESGTPIRTGGSSCPTIICTRAYNAASRGQDDKWRTFGPPHQRYINPQHIVTILDNDCG